MKGSFTIPGESAYEKLTLELADKWGADVVRDSDGTELSSELLESGMEIYSTICLIREHNEFAFAHPQFQQQTILESFPVMAKDRTLQIELLKGYSRDQFEINDSNESLLLWQVFNRTTNKKISCSDWNYKNGLVTINNADPYSVYSVDFFVWRIWEEISMYNHVTNSWDKEHLRQLDPRYPEVREYLCAWLEKWCRQHPHTDVVRFTSLFYNFVWIWGADVRRRDIFTDWGSYDFSVSPATMKAFEEEYGYALTAEDFINQGRRNSNHICHSKAMKDYMDFISSFVSSFASELVDIVHKYGKKAYVFYDDSWIGLEPNGQYFPSIGFDGLIKCVFSGFEARLCAAADSVKVHELRLHPYLFPTGLGGAPTFSEGGHPDIDAKIYWSHVRRALLRQPVDRIGLGGYLHLTENYPEFVQAIAEIADEFRAIKELHKQARPAVSSKRVLILTEWGKQRSWTCGGHYHEHPDLDLINILESLSGLPYEVDFAAPDEINSEYLSSFAVLISAGTEHSAWSGGDMWRDEKLVHTISRWVDEGGIFIAAGEASELEGFSTKLRMSYILGIDLADDRRLCEGRYCLESLDLFSEASISAKHDIVITDPSTEILCWADNIPVITRHAFGNGYGIYLSSFKYSPENTDVLNTLIQNGNEEPELLLSGNPNVDIAVYPATGKIAIANQSSKEEAYCINGTKRSIGPFGFIVD